MGLLATLVGSRLPRKYHKYFNLPDCAESYRLEPGDDDPLARAAAAWRERLGKDCGVIRLDLGTDALGVRVALIERAASSIDIQSYLLRDDLSGKLIASKLAEAADRGVRVRLLMDDALTEGIDTGLLSLDDHPNIEVRVFNPFPRRRSRFVSLIANFNILNRRMHNKSFTVDGSLSIVGGRNLADEYFRSDGQGEFLDEDLLLTGPVVTDVADGFDAYWNAREAFPMRTFSRVVATPDLQGMLEAAREYLAEHRSAALLQDHSARIVNEFLDGQLPMIVAPAELVVDKPEKVRVRLRRPDSRTSVFLREMVAASKCEVLIVSPYFVPQKRGVAFLGSLVASGSRVTVVTNSLASTNHASVHAVYARYRRPLLQCGVELFELKPHAGVDSDDGKSTLHSKVAVVDRQCTFVGSFNLDPRSLYINTEMGVAVDSAELAANFADSIRGQLVDDAYELTLSDSGRLLWQYLDGGEQHVASNEPHAGFWRRLRTRVMSFLPIESQM